MLRQEGSNQQLRMQTIQSRLVETAEGAMQEVTSILQRMRELAIQSAKSDTNSDADQRVSPK